MDSHEGVIDLVHLKQYTGGDPNLEKEILTMFVPNVRGYVEQMAAAEAARTWEHAAHALKGVARGVGAFGLADAAESIEHSYSDDETARRDLLTDLQARLEEVERFVRSHLGG